MNRYVQIEAVTVKLQRIIKGGHITFLIIHYLQHMNDRDANVMIDMWTNYNG